MLETYTAKTVAILPARYFVGWFSLCISKFYQAGAQVIKSLIRYLTLISILLTSQMAHAGFFSSIVHAFSNIPIVGNIIDHYADKAAHGKVNDKINNYYNSALRCSPLETDGNITVKDFVKIKPGFPGWKDLEKIESVANSAASQASTKSTNDKVQHCFAGCMIEKNLNYSSAVLVAFLKEMRDASDCSASTHFEMQDYYATVAGAEAGKRTTCDSFCGSQLNSKRTGSEMLAASKIIPTPRYSPISKYHYRVMEQ
jgi:hypothetical protein